MTDDISPRGKLERMKLDMEMEATLHAAYNLLSCEAQSFVNRGEAWRASLYVPVLKDLERAIDICPRNNIVTQIVDEKHLMAFQQWYEEHKGEFQ